MTHDYIVGNSNIKNLVNFLLEELDRNTVYFYTIERVDNSDYFQYSIQVIFGSEIVARMGAVNDADLVRVLTNEYLHYVASQPSADELTMRRYS